MMLGEILINPKSNESVCLSVINEYIDVLTHIKNISQSEDTTSSLFCCKMEIDQFLAKSCKVCQAWHDPLPHFMSGFALPSPAPLWPEVIYG